MAPPNIPADFDFLDPDLNLERPARRGTRRAAQVRADPLGRRAGRHRRLRRQRLLARHQARRRQGGVAAQRRLLQLAERRHPDLAQGDDARGDRAAARRHAQHGRAAPHPAAQDHLARLHAHAPSDGWRRNSRSARRTSPRPRPPRAPATSSSRCRASCRCRPSPACSACRRRTATSCSAGPTR